LNDETTTKDERRDIMTEKQLRRFKKKEAFERSKEKQNELWSFRDRMEEKMKEKKRKVEEQANQAVPSSAALDRFKRKKAY
jgi:hypothetical protein